MVFTAAQYTSTNIKMRKNKGIDIWALPVFTAQSGH